MIVGFRKIGDVTSYSASEIHHSRVGIGFEKLDRAVFDPTNAYDPVAALGVKWVRIQSGWQRTETERGVYHFEWLDDIVDNLLRRGLQPWICLCYGNGLYDEQASQRFGGVGCPPTTPDELPAWKAYVTACVRHFSGRVTWWEIWNEPDCSYSWRYACNMTEYGKFAIETARAILAGSGEAKIIMGALAESAIKPTWEFFLTGAGDYADAITFHIYSSNEKNDTFKIENLLRIVRHFNPKLEVIMGEGGCQSRHDGSGALHGQMWTEAKQAKSLARHTLCQLGYGLKFVSYFSSMDMIEALNGKVGNKASYMDYGYFGVLGADFNAEGIATGVYRPKPSYRALQVLASLLREDVEAVDDVPYIFEGNDDGRYGSSSRRCYFGAQGDGVDMYYQAFRKPNGAVGFAYWAQTDILRETYEGSISLRFANVPQSCQLVDVVDGAIYELKKEDVHFEESGGVRLVNLPVFDRPVMICFGDFM